MPTFNPIWVHFPATYKIIFGRAAGACKGVWTQNGQRKERGDRDRCKFWKHDDAMHMMTWQDATRKRMTWQWQRITGRHLARRSRGATTLHHYERISSRDLELHRRENGREREEVKLSCFFDQWLKPWTLRGWTTWKKELQRRWMKLKTLRYETGTRNITRTL